VRRGRSRGFAEKRGGTINEVRGSGWKFSAKRTRRGGFVENWGENAFRKQNAERKKKVK